MKKDAIKVIYKPDLFEESNEKEDIITRLKSLKQTDDEEIILIVPHKVFRLINPFIWDLYLANILFFSESIYKNLKSSLPLELLEDAIIVKVKHFYQAFIRTIIDKELEQIFFKDLLEVEAKEKIGVRSLSTIARILSQIRLKVEPGWVNLINEKAKLKILALVLLTINKREIPLIIEIKGFNKKPNVQELTEILKQFLIKFAELIVSKKSSSFIKVNTPQGTFEIKDLTKEIGKEIAIITKDGKVFRNLPNPNEIANKKLKFISLKGGLI